MYALAVMLASRAARPPNTLPQFTYTPYWLNEVEPLVGVQALFNGKWQWQRSVLGRLDQMKIDRECKAHIGVVRYSWRPDRSADVWLRAMVGENTA